MGNSQLSPVTIQDVFSIEREMLKMPQVELPVKHYFSPGVYARELTIYAGHVLTGAVHKYEQLNILSKGSMRLLTESGIRDVHAPYTVVSPAGTKRIALALTECVWTTILRTDETDIPTIEKEFTCKTEQEYLTWLSQSQQLSVSPALALPPPEPSLATWVLRITNGLKKLSSRLTKSMRTLLTPQL